MWGSRSPLWSVPYSDLMLWPIPASSSPPEPRPLLHLALPSRQVLQAGLGSLTGSLTGLSTGLPSLCYFILIPPVFPPRLTKPQKYIFGTRVEIAVQAWALIESFRGLAS